ncbi:acyltransferase [Mycolicibacterium wolinskyi]|uniref:Acyltransferase n=1 Tax=Mycolicibacterium wolinskyi TaxID=59750 RepID=A0A1X2F5Z5_9MYCO|nr:MULTISPECIES: condensation domain-containing protein [Mycolicibacterium]MCV7284178.1 acyltransferase [Mycolicibacterium wolinskyi]MCV7294014.1 acyltransferase [Mycolicibacterium goodii]ORX13836.1 acyltransferase [Mycolicibacterium wolinskyi]
MLLGPVEIASIDEWTPEPGSLISWQPTEAALAKAREAPESPVPASYIQTRHLRSFVEQGSRGVDHSRLFIAACDMPGRCDIRAMTYVINAHLRRHSTYRSWFEYRRADDPGTADTVVRHTMTDAADIEFVPKRHGAADAAKLRSQVASTPDSLQWDSFRFGVIQREDKFTFWSSIDHLHVDGQFVGVGLLEFQAMYSTLVSGAPPLQLPDAGGYDDYCLRQREFTSSLTLDTPEVQTWKSFAEKNNGTFPVFPLPLDDGSPSEGGDLVAVKLMDRQQTERFEDLCVAAGSRFIGGLFAVVAHALRELTGLETYYGLTPIDTRTPDELTTQGWFTGLIPVVVPVAGASFADSIRAAQRDFDTGRPAALVPFERVVELAPHLTPPQPLFPMLNFFDASSGPMAPLLTNLQEGVRIATLSDGRVTYPLSTLVGRFNETFATVVFPKNPVARQSVDRYVAALQEVCDRVTGGRDVLVAATRNEAERQPVR